MARLNLLQFSLVHIRVQFSLNKVDKIALKLAEALELLQTMHCFWFAIQLGRNNKY